MTLILRELGGLGILSGDGRLLRLTPGAAAVSSTLAVSMLDFVPGHSLAEPVYQRKAGTYDDTIPGQAGSADVEFEFAFTGAAPQSVQARVVSADGGAIIKDWTTLTSLQITGSTGSGVLPGVPSGCEYLRQIRDGGNHANVSAIGTQRWGVGSRWEWWGQSNMQETFKAGGYNHPVPGSGDEERYYWLHPNNAPAHFGPNSFTVPQTIGGTGYNGTGIGGNTDPAYGGLMSFPRMLSAALSARHGRKIPVCMIPWAQGATNIASFLPGSDLFETLFNRSGTTPGNIGLSSPSRYSAGGDIEGSVGLHGEANSFGLSTSLRTNYTADLKTLYNGQLAHVAKYGRTAADFTFLMCVLGTYGDTGIEHIRGAVLDFDKWARDNNLARVGAGWTTIDCDPNDSSDGQHFRDVPGGFPYALWSHRRATQAIFHRMGLSAHGGLGPRLTGATRAGMVATLAVQYDGGTSLVARTPGAPLSGWSANTLQAFTGASVPVTVTLENGVPKATFPPGTVFPVWLKYMGGAVGTAASYRPDLTNPLYQVTPLFPTGATGYDALDRLPVIPTPDSIEVA